MEWEGEVVLFSFDGHIYSGCLLEAFLDFLIFLQWICVPSLIKKSM